MHASSGFSHGTASRRCETWIVLELCPLGSLQVCAYADRSHWRACTPRTTTQHVQCVHLDAT